MATRARDDERVVLPAVEGEIERVGAERTQPPRRASRVGEQGALVEHGADAARVGQVPDVAREAVGHVDRGVGDEPHRAPLGDQRPRRAPGADGDRGRRSAFPAPSARRPAAASPTRPAIQRPSPATAPAAKHRRDRTSRGASSRSRAPDRARGCRRRPAPPPRAAAACCPRAICSSAASSTSSGTTSAESAHHGAAPIAATSLAAAMKLRHPTSRQPTRSRRKCVPSTCSSTVHTRRRPSPTASTAASSPMPTSIAGSARRAEQRPA